MRTPGRVAWLRPLDQRGVTLVEVVIVGVLASIVMLALTGFYINSQGTWIEASSQALTQREVSFALETIADSVHTAASADPGTPESQSLILFDHDGNETCTFSVDPNDGLLHQSKGGVDRGALATSAVTRFEVTSDPTMVRILALEMRSAQGRLIGMSTGAVFYNK
jgi:type II secretory pathway pseudopilin PulG